MHLFATAIPHVTSRGCAGLGLRLCVSLGLFAGASACTHDKVAMPEEDAPCTNSVGDADADAPASLAIAQQPHVAARYLIVIGASAVKRTNMQILKDEVRVASCLEATAPYRAEFEFVVRRPNVGDYNVWAQVRFDSAEGESPWRWSHNESPAEVGVVSEPPNGGGHQWAKIGAVHLAEGTNTMRFVLAGRRVFPDDSYVFGLRRMILAPVEEDFLPTQPNAAFQYDPRKWLREPSHFGSQADGGRTKGMVVYYETEAARSVSLSVNGTRVVERIEPIWRDYSDGGMANPYGDILIPRLVTPLRPRFIHCRQVLAGTSARRGDDGRIAYDFGPSVATVRSIRVVGGEPILDLSDVPAPIREGVHPRDWSTNAKFQSEWYEAVTLFLTALRDSDVAATHFTSLYGPEWGCATAGGNLDAAMADS
jgi:hypothetical protein